MMGGHKATRPILRLVSDAEKKIVKVEKADTASSTYIGKEPDSLASENYSPSAEGTPPENQASPPFTKVTPKACDTPPQIQPPSQNQNIPDFTPYSLEKLYQSQIGKATQQAMDIIATGILGHGPKTSNEVGHSVSLLYQKVINDKIAEKKATEAVEDHGPKDQLPIQEIPMVKSTEAYTEPSGDVMMDTPAVLADTTQELPTAFWKVWSGHHDYLLKQCLRMMAGNRFDAEDALSSAMVRASQKFDRFADQIVNERAWLSRLVHNVCIDHFRVDKRTDTRDFQDQQHHDLSQAMFCEPSLTPEEQALSREQLALLQEEVEGMSEKLRRPLIMRFVDGMSYGEIAEILGLRADTVRKRIQLARDQLRAAGIR